jgi:hypothetical protein
VALVKIDEPGAGDWIAAQFQGTFNHGMDHSFSSHAEDDNTILGGIMVSMFFGNSMTCHMAGQNQHWFSRELAWLVFDYCFNQCGCHKMFAGVRSDNHRALAINMRGGWQVETSLKDVFAPGVDMVVLWMTRESCPWLNYRPRHFRSNLQRLLPGVTQHG